MFTIFTKKINVLIIACLALTLIACSNKQIKFNEKDVTKIEITLEYPPFETFEVSEEDQKAIIEFLNRKETFSQVVPMHDDLAGEGVILKIYGKETTVIDLLYPYLILGDTWYSVGLNNELRDITSKYEGYSTNDQ